MNNGITASIKARLLNRAKESGEEFQFVLMRYACERLLYRLGASRVRERCTLKLVFDSISGGAETQI